MSYIPWDSYSANLIESINWSHCLSCSVLSEVRGTFSINDPTPLGSWGWVDPVTGGGISIGPKRKELNPTWKGRDGWETNVSVTAVVHTNGKLCKQSSLPCSFSHVFVQSLCLNEASKAVLLWFDVLTLPCHSDVMSLVGQEWWNQEECLCVCVRAWVRTCVCLCVYGYNAQCLNHASFVSVICSSIKGDSEDMQW